VWPNLGSVAVACTIGMIGRTWKAMSITKCVGAVMLTEKEGVLTQALVQEVSLEPGAAESTAQARGDLARRGIYLSPPHQRAQFCAWPNLGSAALACTIGKSGRIRKTLITSTCVGAVVLKETRGALHGAQIPETPGHWANQAPTDHRDVRQQLLDAIYSGQPFRTVLRDLGLTSNQVWG
jgi:hypothetical protein